MNMMGVFFGIRLFGGYAAKVHQAHDTEQLRLIGFT